MAFCSGSDVGHMTSKYGGQLINWDLLFETVKRKRKEIKKNRNTHY